MLGQKTLITIVISIILLGLAGFFVAQRFGLFYRCPREGEYMSSGNSKWVDCMPSVNINTATDKFCEPKYRSWAEKNCPYIKFTD